MLLSDHPRTEGDCSGRESKLWWEVDGEVDGEEDAIAAAAGRL